MVEKGLIFAHCAISNRRYFVGKLIEASWWEYCSEFWVAVRLWPIPFFRKFRITCPPRAVNLMTPRSGKKPRERTSRNPTAGRKNRQRKRTVRHQTSCRTGEILHSQQDLTTAVHNIALYVYTTSTNTVLDYSNIRSIKPPPAWALIHSRYAISTDRFDPTGCSLVDNSQRIYHARISENKARINEIYRKSRKLKFRMFQDANEEREEKLKCVADVFFLFFLIFFFFSSFFIYTCHLFYLVVEECVLEGSSSIPRETLIKI